MTRLVDARAPSHITKERIKLLRRMEGETCKGQVLVVVAIKLSIVLELRLRSAT